MIHAFERTGRSNARRLQVGHSWLWKFPNSRASERFDRCTWTFSIGYSYSYSVASNATLDGRQRDLAI